MCGILGVTGSAGAYDLLVEGLARLEYRGYDSAGLAVHHDGGLWRTRAATGTRSLDTLRTQLDGASPPGVHCGVGHTRWATHGAPTEANAHPHFDCKGRVAVVHNGIIENAGQLRRELEGRGHHFESVTDTEVLAHLVEEHLGDGLETAPAVRAALGALRGAYAVAVTAETDPELIVAARRLSPLVVALGDADPADGTPPAGLVASDIPALLGQTRRFFVLEDDQVAEVRPGSLRVTSLDGTEVTPSVLQVDWDLEHAQKGGYDDFMSKEIHEQPRAVADTLLGRLDVAAGAELDQLRVGTDGLDQVDKVVIVACGSSYHAGLVARFAMERWARVAVEVDISSEFRYRDPVLDERTLVVGISQSGETADTLQAIRLARARGARVLVVSNVVDSSMAREADAVLYTRAGPEIGVAATKTHLAQLTALELLALELAHARGGLPEDETRRLLGALGAVPDLVAEAVERSGAVEDVAARHAAVRDMFFVGRHVGLPVALEGALKVKEISYLRAEAYPAGELKHGPIALIEPGTVVVAVATRTPLWEKTMANIAEVKSRGATVILVANDGDEEAAAHAEEVLWVPPTGDPLLAPLVDVVPLQLLAYHLARFHGHDVDRPRNLAKTVTVE